MTLDELTAKWNKEIKQKELEASQDYQMKVLEAAGYEFFPGEIVKRDGRMIQQGLPLWKSVQVCYQSYLTSSAISSRNFANDS